MCGAPLVRRNRPPVSTDASAGVGAFEPKAHRFRLAHDDGKHRHGAVGRDRGCAQRGEPVVDFPAVDVSDRASRKIRQDLLAQISPIRVEGFLHRPRGIGFKETAVDHEVHDLAEKAERPIGVWESPSWTVGSVGPDNCPPVMAVSIAFPIRSAAASTSRSLTWA